MKFCCDLFEVKFEADPKFVLRPVSDDFCQDWNWKPPKQLPRTAAELLRITAYRRTLKLPFIVMVAFSFHSWLFTPAHTLFHFNLYGSLYGYSLPRIAPTSTLKLILFFLLLFVIIPFSSFQLLVQLMRLLIFSSTASVQPHLMY